MKNLKSFIANKWIMISLLISMIEMDVFIVWTEIFDYCPADGYDLFVIWYLTGMIAGFFMALNGLFFGFLAWTWRDLKKKRES